MNEDIFDRRKNAPLWWFNKSSDLHASARILWLAMHDDNNNPFSTNLNLGQGFNLRVACWPVYQMLYGMALELSFKAISVVSMCEPKKTHDLPELAKKTGIEFTKDELEMLKLLTESIVWDGRYPVPTKKEFLHNHYDHASNVLSHKENRKGVVLRTYNGALDWENLEPIWEKAQTKFFELRNS